MSDIKTSSSEYVVSSNSDLIALTEKLGLLPSDDEPDREFIIEDEYGFFKIRENGGYLISSYYHNKIADNRTIGKTQITEFVERTLKLYEDYQHLKVRTSIDNALSEANLERL